MKRTLTLATMITLGAAAWMPLPSMAQTGFNLVINSAPPAPRFESVPAARRGYVWAPGYWNWDGGRHVWLAGHWEPERNGYQYRSSEWIRDGGGYRLNNGGWQPVAQVRYDEIRVAPPAPRYERIPRSRDGYVWQPGLLGLARQPLRVELGHLGRRTSRLRLLAAELGAARWPLVHGTVALVASAVAATVTTTACRTASNMAATATATACPTASSTTAAATRTAMACRTAATPTVTAMACRTAATPVRTIRAAINVA